MSKTPENERAVLQEILHLNETYNRPEWFPATKKGKKRKATKLSGAIVVEVLKSEFIKRGFVVSNRDVYLEKIPNELDLLILVQGAKPTKDLIYLAKDVKFVLEVKYNGSYGEKSIESLKKTFNRIRDQYPSIPCAYVTIWERKTYKHKITEENLGHRCFTIFTGPGDLEKAVKKDKVEATGDWGSFFSFLDSVKLNEKY